MISEYEAWIGRSEIFVDILSEVNCRRFYHTLNIKDPIPTIGQNVFPMIILTLGEKSTPIENLGEDGHPIRGDFIPPISLKRRMFAGGEYEFYHPLKVGSEVKIICKIKEIFKKKGKTGELIFVKIRKDFYINDLKCARETRSLVFSDCNPNSQPEGIVGKTGEWIEQLNSNPIQLFKFSALTFNGHRIHYDRKYAIENEGYPSLVVHGPLIASLLSFFAEKKTGRKLSKFNFKGIRPIFEINKFFLTGEKIENNSSNLKVLDHESKIAVEARCEFF